MTTNIRLRSPYYIYKTQAGSSYATIEIKVNGGVIYTMTKNSQSNGSVAFEISELIEDYIDVVFFGSYTSTTVDVETTVKFYNQDDVELDSYVDNFSGFDAYGEFKDGSNPIITPNALLQSNNIMYVPDNATGFIPTESNGNILYNQFIGSDTSKTVSGHTVTINRVCEPKYDPIKITFVNKFGALQDLWFFKKMVKTLNTSKESFKRNILSSSGSYSTFKHSKRTLNVVGNEIFTANTGFLDESMNEPFKELMLSKQIWATIDGIVYPISVTSNKMQYKTSLNDKMVNFTMDFEYAYDTINNIR